MCDVGTYIPKQVTSLIKTHWSTTVLQIKEQFALYHLTVWKVVLGDIFCGRHLPPKQILALTNQRWKALKDADIVIPFSEGEEDEETPQITRIVVQRKKANSIKR